MLTVGGVDQREWLHDRGDQQHANQQCLDKLSIAVLVKKPSEEAMTVIVSAYLASVFGGFVVVHTLSFERWPAAIAPHHSFSAICRRSAVLSPIEGTRYLPESLRWRSKPVSGAIRPRVHTSSG